MYVLGSEAIEDFDDVESETDQGNSGAHPRHGRVLKGEPRAQPSQISFRGNPQDETVRAGVVVFVSCHSSGTATRIFPSATSTG
jgi:hypothetical protein